MENKDFEIKNGVLLRYHGKESHVVIPDGVTKIADFAFLNCDAESINIPNSVKYIGGHAFAHCLFLTSINIPNSVIRIDDRAFAICESLEIVNIQSSVISIGDEAFIRIKDIKYPRSIDGKLIAYKAFNKDWTCRGFKYEVGQSYHQDGKIECGSNGFHACLNPLDIFNYYNGELSGLHFAEVELSGRIEDDNIIWYHRVDTKVAASDIKIIREVTFGELVRIYNSMEKR